MILKRYRSQLAETTDDQLRHEFLRLIAQEGRLHFMSQIAEDNIGDSSNSKTAPLLSHPGGN
jgi:F0F1-type ATP synthase delta subunit